VGGSARRRRLAEGTLTWGVHVSLVTRWLDPAETEGVIIPFMMLYALHDALVRIKKP
jgi:peptide/nickel transport system substrate-binding protein